MDPVARLPAVLALVAGGGRFRSAEAPPGTSVRQPRLGQIMTPREQLVFSVLGSGCTDGTAGRMFGLAPETVHWYRCRIMHKLGVTDRGSLIRSALRLGVVRQAGTQMLHPGFGQSLVARTGGRSSVGRGADVPAS